MIGCVQNTNWLRYMQLHDSKSDIVVWIHKPSLGYLGSDSCIKDMGLINGLIKENKSFRVVFGKKVGKIHHKTIFFTLEDTYNVFGFENYTDILHHITSQLESQSNKVFPSSKEVMFWENKAFMHDEFKKAGVSEPLTRMFTSYDDLKKANVSYPFLIKAEHSCSANGLYKISSETDLENLMVKSNFLNENKIIIAQEMINMRKDLRVILVGDEIVLHYWRINLGKEWKPTSTSYGSDVDFVFFPEQWKQHVLKTFKNLDLTTGAFDITWQNDDLTTEPLYLEVSPVFQPNPPMELNGKPYAHYKKKLNLLKSWDIRYVKVVFEIKHKEVVASLNKIQKI
jgi:glutathione synthase/RimK-type ligase-like ATP-grasp enzyme